MPRLSVALLSWLVFAVVASAATPRFAHEESDLSPDPRARFGALPNGLRFVILPNAEPKERAALRLVVLAGSLHETEEQRGLAHFLEHMAFNGSEHYPPGTLVEYFQRLGMNFGGDTNAYTSFDHTAYMINLPDTQPATLAEGFKVFADYAGGLLLREEEIERERGIILSEKRTRDSAEFRRFVAEFEFLLSQSLFPARLPIGVESVISTAPRAAFTEFYNAWYRPERIIVIAVGDFDPAIVERELTAAFTPLQARAEAKEAPDLGRVPTASGVRVAYQFDPEASNTKVSLQTIEPYAREPDTAATRRQRVARDLAVDIVNRRLSILAKQEGAPFTRASLGISEGYDFFRNAGIDLYCQPNDWAAALAVGEQEWRRAIAHGFQPAELQEAVAVQLNALEQAARTAATRRSPQLAQALISSVVRHRVFTTPAAERELLRPVLESVTVEDCWEALRAALAAEGRFISVMGNARLEGEAEAAIAGAYEQSLAQAVAPPEALGEQAFAYLDFGAPGAIAEREHVADLDLTLITFANGLRLNLKQTDFEAGQIRLSLRVGTGQLTEPRERPGLAFLASHTFTAGGLGQHSLDELQRLLAGKTVGVGFQVGADALLFQGTTQPDDLAWQLRLFAAYLTDPGYRPEAWRVAQRTLDQLYTRLQHTPEGPLQIEGSRLLAGGDPRFGVPRREETFARTTDEVQAWLAPQLAAGALELALVGDFDPEAAIEAVAATLGALPPREPRPALTEERRVRTPETPLTRSFEVASEIPKARVALYWPTTDASEIGRTRRLSLLAAVFNDRLRVKVREELGGAYSPSAGSLPSETYPGYGFMVAQVTVDPAAAESIVVTLREIAADLHAHGVTEEELTRAKQPILTSLRESARTNAYWLGAVLGRAQEKPEVLDWARTRYTDFNAITKADLDALARTYLNPDRAFQFIVKPVAAPSPAPSPAVRAGDPE